MHRRATARAAAARPSRWRGCGSAARTRWSVATQSDGSVVVTRTEGRSGGAGVGLGVEASPFGLELGVEGEARLHGQQGAAWEFPDAAAAARLPRRQRRTPEPTWRFGEAGDVLTAEAGAKIGGATLTGVAGVDAGGGRRRAWARAATTLYVRSRLDTGATVWLPRHRSQLAGPSTGDVMVELTLEHGGLPRDRVPHRRARVGARAGGRHGRAARPARSRRTARSRERGCSLRGLAAGAARARRGPAARLMLRHACSAALVERSVYAVTTSSTRAALAARSASSSGSTSTRSTVQRPPRARQRVDPPDRRERRARGLLSRR